jgi:hypothetical protein
MGQHTWFSKNKQLYLQQEKLYDKIDAHEKNEIYLDEIELLQIESEIDEIDEKNNTDYQDLFRTGKRNSDGTYTDDIIFSRKECFDWIENPENLVSFKNTIFDTDEQEEINRKRAINKLNAFWDEYPDGIIHFR